MKNWVAEGIAPDVNDFIRHYASFPKKPVVKVTWIISKLPSIKHCCDDTNTLAPPPFMKFPSKAQLLSDHF